MAGFKGRQEHLSVTTLGGKVTDYHTVTTYTCSMLATDGNLYEFEAYGMDCITSALTNVNRNVIRRLFPHLDGRTISNLQRANDVHVLVGMKHPSWH